MIEGDKNAINDINKKVAEILKGKPIEIAARTSLQKTVRRIFVDGQKTNNSSIGTYDTKRELWVPDSQLPRKGNHKGKTGKTIKTTYFKNYKELRSRMGREDSFVNLRLLNELQSDISNANISRASNQVANPIPTRLNNLRYAVILNKQINIDKVNDLESKYGRIFAPTQNEIEIFIRVADFETNKILNA